MTIQPTTPPVVYPTTQAPAMQRQKSSQGRMDVFVQDIGASLKEAGHEIHDAFGKLHAKKSPVLSPVAPSPVATPATQPALPPPVFQGSEVQTPRSRICPQVCPS